jgi:exonuclease III
MPLITLTLLEHAADVVVITEYRRTTGGQIAGVLADHGLCHQVCSDPPRGRNGVLIASHTPLEMCGDPTHRWAEVLLPETGLRVAAIHAPHDDPINRSAAARNRSGYFQTLVSTARARASEPFVLIGDFNAGRPVLDGHGHTLTTGGGPYFLGMLATLGYTDAWRHLHPDSREYSWFSHEGDGFRIDHAFVSRPLVPAIRSCEYSHGERQANLSDHSLLALTIADFSTNSAVFGGRTLADAPRTR